DLGRIAPGARADLVLLDLNVPSMLPARDPLRNFLFHAADRAVKRVLIDGETVFAEGCPTGLDPVAAGALLAEAQTRMLRDARRHDFASRDGEEIAPLS